MFRKIITSLVLLLSVSTYQLYAQGSEMYFGSQGNQVNVYDNMDAAHLDTMKNLLGFNVYSPLGAWPTIINLMDDSLKLIPDMVETRGNPLPEYLDYLYAHYAVVQAEDVTHQIRFRSIDGYDSIGFVYGPVDPQGDTAIFLDSLWYKYSAKDAGALKYGLLVNIDTDGLTYNDTLGFLRIRTGAWYWNHIDSLEYATFYIVSNPFLDSSQATCYLEFELENLT